MIIMWNIVCRAKFTIRSRFTIKTFSIDTVCLKAARNSCILICYVVCAPLKKDFNSPTNVLKFALILYWVKLKIFVSIHVFRGFTKLLEKTDFVLINVNFLILLKARKNSLKRMFRLLVFIVMLCFVMLIALYLILLLFWMLTNNMFVIFVIF